MNLEQCAQVATIFGALAIPVSALLLRAQLRYQTRLTQVTNAQALTELASSLNLQLIQDKDVARLWVDGQRNFGSFSPLDQFRYSELLTWWLLLHETVFVQRQGGLLDQDTYSAWQADLQAFVAQHNLQAHWAPLALKLHPVFSKHLEHLLAAA